jgi:hypothetical protein
VGAAILLDIVSGLLKASYQKNFKSCRMRDGLYHKFGEILVLALLYGVEYGAPMIGVETGLPLFKAGAGYVVLMEIASIIENLRVFTPGIDNIVKPMKKEN